LSNEVTVDEADDLDGVPDMLDNLHIKIAEEKEVSRHDAGFYSTERPI
jgi:hypothetical protein